VVKVMENNPKKFVELTPELHARCLEYIRRRGLGEKTKLYYSNELEKIFKQPILTQRFIIGFIQGGATMDRS